MFGRSSLIVCSVSNIEKLLLGGTGLSPDDKSVNWVDQFWEKAQVVADWSADAEKTVKEAKSDAPGQAVGGRTGPRIGGN